MANSTKSSEMVCSRCRCPGHSAKDNCLLFAKSNAERRAEARSEAAKKRVEREARQEVRARKMALQRAAPRRSLKAFDEESIATDVSTMASSTSLAVDEAEVERLALLDKDVRRFAKILRETEKLEGRSDLDELQ